MRRWMTMVALFFNIAVTWSAEFDLVIRGGRIIDGTGAPWYFADVGVRAGKIEALGRLPVGAGKEEIDATGLIVAPGFIDLMGQSASPLVDDPKAAINMLTQGITTINAGEGQSAAPLAPDVGKRLGYTTMREYFALLELAGLPINVVQTVGHTQVRQIVMGDVDRRCTDEELGRMQALVREGMEAGAIGMSTALIYPPAVFATTEEIAALARVAGQFGGKYYTHLRNEGDQLLPAIDEALAIGREGNAPVHIFHLKTAGRQNWSKMPLAIAKLRQARAVGQAVAADIYPYVNNGLEISALVHPRHFAAGRAAFRDKISDPAARQEIRQEMETTDGWENWYRHVGKDWSRIVIGQSGVPTHRELLGRSVAAIAEHFKQDPWETFFDLVQAGAFALPQSMTEVNKILALKEDFVSYCTDVGPVSASRSASHPRAFGSFPRVYGRYVRELGVLSPERFVAQASAVAANEVLAFDRGRIAIGLAADLSVFDPDQFTDRATFAQPHAIAEGMRHVIVNGAVVLRDGKMTSAKPGRVLRGPGYQRSTAPAAVSQGTLDPKLSSFDRMMHDFIDQHRLPGAALAVVDHGRLVLARGYGYADLATLEPVLPTSRFRIASISKPLTAIAILRLQEQGRLALEDKVFEILDWTAESQSAGAKFDDRQRAITLRHLLEHRGGWDRDRSFDAMFEPVKFAQQFDQPAPAGPREVMRAMLRVTLDFTPGERFAYSNYGYCLLGRVIEKVTGMGYERYMQEQILRPIGARTMQLGATRWDERSVDEVRYYQPGTSRSVFQSDLGQATPRQYGGWSLEAMDAHGGWIASAVDLARVAAALSDPDRCPLLTRGSIELMHGRPPGLAGHDAEGKPKEVYYSLGWSNRELPGGQVNHWHTGSLAGTAATFIRRHDGRDFIALFNTRTSPAGNHLGREIDPLLHQAAHAVTAWPEGDLFRQFDQQN